MSQKHQVAPENAERILGWLETRGGILIWQSINLSNPGASWTSPAKTEDGQPAEKPNWQCSNKPARHITDPAECEVSVPKEVKRFHVAVRVGGNGLSLKVTDGGTRRIRAAVVKAEEKYGEAWHSFDYSTQEAVILVPDKKVPLEQFLAEKTGTSADVAS